jgi:cell fate regulator YaaT (PSP1 superfamily)
MACSSCSSKGCGTTQSSTIDNGVKGCKSGGACGCNKMNTFDWLQEMELPKDTRFDVVEVRFRNGRKEFCRNIHNLDLTTGDTIVVEGQGGGYDVGFVSLQGELTRLQMLKKKVKDNEEIKAIWRIANPKDVEKYEQVAQRNLPTLFRTRQIAMELNLKMKLSDVDFQADNTKATFYYSADDRVDFRELIKILAGEFKIRVEMRQISLRQEAARIGGIGSCGLELCCSTWLTDFKSVPTLAARYQNLSLNPSKLSGQCGRLKCCLNYELDTYEEALKDIPKIEKPIKTQKGLAELTKTDIFKKMMWFCYQNETIWHPISCQRVEEILKLNEQGIAPATLQNDEMELKQSLYSKDAGSSILDRMEKDEKKKKRENQKNQKNKPYKKTNTTETKPNNTNINANSQSGKNNPTINRNQNNQINKNNNKNNQNQTNPNNNNQKNIENQNNKHKNKNNNYKGKNPNDKQKPE